MLLPNLELHARNNYDDKFKLSVNHKATDFLQ